LCGTSVGRIAAESIKDRQQVTSVAEVIPAVTGFRVRKDFCGTSWRPSVRKSESAAEGNSISIGE